MLFKLFSIYLLTFFLPLFADSYNYQLSKEYNLKKDYKNALKYSIQALTIDLDNNMSTYESISTDYNNVAYFYQKLNKWQEALTYYLKALETINKDKKIKYLKKHTIYYNNIATIYDQLKLYDKALEFYKKSSLIYEKKLPKLHPYKATTYSDIGNIYLKLNNKELALTYHLKALNIRKKGKLKPTHPDMLLSYYTVAELNRVLNKKVDAKKYYKELIKIYRENNIENNTTKIIEKNLNLLL